MVGAGLRDDDPRKSDLGARLSHKRLRLLGLLPRCSTGLSTDQGG